ncbi:MAG: serine/threonine-protein kinase [Pirellulales bacterium]
MIQNNNHLSDRQLQSLLFEPEESLDSTEIALHIEHCQTCQMRLTELADETSIEPEVCQMLSGYSQAVRSADSGSSGSGSIDVKSNRVEPDLSFDKALLDPPTHPEMLGRIGRYEIERCIGSGGMGVVFKAIDTELNRPVAVKVLAPHLARNGAARQRFSRESRAAAAVVHEHVVAIHNVDSSVEYPYLVMQYVSGESLQSRVDREGPLSVEQILRIGIQAALGLAAAHEQGIVHRDIKPANILLEDSVERLLITDFGLARTVDDASLTHTGVVAGTPNYMSPEQAKGEQADHRTDLFSLGAVLYFVATGHPPFRAERAMGVLNRICHERHRPVWQVNSAIPDELSMVIDRLLEKRPSRRFANATNVAETLARILQQLQNRKPRFTNRLRSWGRRHSQTTAAILVATIGISGWLAWSNYFLFDSTVVDRTSSANTTSLLPNAGSDPLKQPSASGESRGGSIGNAQTSGVSSAGATASENRFVDFVNADRTEFDQSVQSLNHALDRLGSSRSTFGLEPSPNFQRELESLDQSLRTIDPTR